MTDFFLGSLHKMIMMDFNRNTTGEYYRNNDIKDSFENYEKGFKNGSIGVLLFNTNFFFNLGVFNGYRKNHGSVPNELKTIAESYDGFFDAILNNISQEKLNKEANFCGYELGVFKEKFFIEQQCKSTIEIYKETLREIKELD